MTGQANFVDEILKLYKQEVSSVEVFIVVHQAVRPPPQKSNRPPHQSSVLAEQVEPYVAM